MTAKDAIHDGATILDDRGKRVTESFASGGLIWPTKPCPVLIDHDERFPVGFVCDFAERDGWNEATLVLNMDKPLSDVAQDLLRVGTPVSIGAKSLLRDECLADLGLNIPVKRHTTAVLEEVSILSPGVKPAYKGARVVRVEERGTALDRMRERQEREPAQAKPTPPKQTALDLHLTHCAQWKETRARLAALGIDVSNYRRPLPLHRSEMESTPAVAREVIDSPPGTMIRRNVGRALRTRQGYPIRYVGADLIVDRPDGSQEIYCGREGRAEAIRDGVLVR